MIRVSSGKPRIAFHRATNDSWHFYPSTFVVNKSWIMTCEDYVEKKEFEDFDLTELCSQEDYDKIYYAMANNEHVDNYQEFVKLIPHHISNRFNRLLEKSKGRFIWEYDAYNEDLTGYVHRFVGLGQPLTVRWNWFDYKITYRLLKLICKLLNFVLAFNNWIAKRRWDKIIKDLSIED